MNYVKKIFSLENSLDNCKNNDYRLSILEKLIVMYLRIGDSNSARKLVNEYANFDRTRGNFLFGLLENYELNWHKALEHFNSSFMNNPYLAMLKVADVYMQLGNYSDSEYLLKELGKNPEYHIDSILYLAKLYMCRLDFFKVYDLLNSLNDVPLSNITQKRTFYFLRLVSMYYLGLMPQVPDSNKNYTEQRIYSEGDDSLFGHVEKHFYVPEYKTGFYESINLDELMVEARDTLNEANYYIADNGVEKYKISLDKTIGEVYGNPTNNIEFVLFPFNKQILTFYPTHYSSEFDMEGNSQSKELKINRIRGGQK